MCPSQDRGLNHVIEAVQGTVTERNAIRRQNRDPNLVRDQNLHQDLGHGRRVNLAVNDRAATIIRYQHCQGKNVMQISPSVNVNSIQNCFVFLFYVGIMVVAENRQASN